MKITPRIVLVFASLFAVATTNAQTDSYTFLYKDGAPVNLTRTNNRGVTAGAFGFGGILYKDGNYTLFPLPGSNTQTPQVSDINDGGEIVGEYFTPAAVGYLLKDGVITILQVPGGGRTTPQGLNNRGVVVGTFHVGPGQQTQAFIYRNGQYTKVGIPGVTFVNFWDVNDAGDVVGEATTLIGGDFQSYSFIYRDGEITPTPTYPGAERTSVYSINKSGKMTGRILRLVGSDSQQLGFILRNGVFETFRLQGSLAFVPFGITDQGDVTGTYFTTNFEGTTFIRPAKQP